MYIITTTERLDHDPLGPPRAHSYMVMGKRRVRKKTVE